VVGAVDKRSCVPLAGFVDWLVGWLDEACGKAQEREGRRIGPRGSAFRVILQTRSLERLFWAGREWGKTPKGDAKGVAQDAYPERRTILSSHPDLARVRIVSYS
jgi:hypothetical protein